MMRRSPYEAGMPLLRPESRKRRILSALCGGHVCGVAEPMPAENQLRRDPLYLNLLAA
jgi:hypothetical protein